MVVDKPYDAVLWAEAAHLRREFWGNRIFLRGIIEFSNHCRQNCLYCGLRRDNAALPRYRLDTDALLACAVRIKRLGIGTVVLQSGEDDALDANEMARIVEAVKAMGLAVTLSLGERDAASFRLWREAGADRYLLKFETGNPARYARLRPGRTLEARLDALRCLQDAGYETGSGMILGLPEETEADMIHDLALLTTLQPDMVSVSPFVPHPATPLAGCPACPDRRILDGMARTRIALPRAHMPVTSALSLRGEAMRLLALQVGNVIMPSLTPENVREAYMIYPGKNRQPTAPEERAAAMRDSLLAAGFELPEGPGSAWRLSQ